MIVFRGTRKVLNEIELNPKAFPDPGEGILGSWFVHIFRINRRKSAIYMNDRTRYSVIVFDVTKVDLADLNLGFINGQEANLRTDNIPDEAVREVVRSCHPMHWGATNSQSVLGMMNDRITVCKTVFPELFDSQERGVAGGVKPRIVGEEHPILR
jgi:Domain of unknown function (DUF6933)